MKGPLAGLRVVELVGQGPGPYGAMLLADLGCDVVAVDRAAAADTSRPATNPMARGKRSVVLDLKAPADREVLLTLLDQADVLIDPFRPGVCERLGVGPDVVTARNPRLIYARMTGWGQDGPWAQAAGHDIDYIALSGALHAIGYEGQPPTMPINLLGDFAGGGLVLAMGVACAAFERTQSGLGQVIDVAMVDGAAMIFGPFFSAVAGGGWGPRGTNHLDGAAPFYGVYETADGGWMVRRGLFEVERDAALVAVQMQKLARHVRVTPAPREVARDVAGGCFHLDHIRAVIRHDLRGERAHHHRGQINNAHTFEGSTGHQNDSK